MPTSTPKVLVILTNYKRPHNLPKCVTAWNCQSLSPYKLVVVDNGSIYDRLYDNVGAEHYPQKYLEGADDVWRMTENLGCPCHFAPALCLYDHDYVLFADDDLVPGEQCLEYITGLTEQVDNCFTSIGQHCRVFGSKPGARYSGRMHPIRDDNHLIKCDSSCRAHLVRGDVMHHIVEFRNRLLRQHGSAAARLVCVHDDLLMNLGIQMGTGWPSYVMPVCSAEQQLIHHNLDEGSVAQWRKPTHFVDRCTFVDLAAMVGWKSLI